MTGKNSKKDSRRRVERHVEDIQLMDTGISHWRMTIRTPSWHPPTDVFETCLLYTSPSPRDRS